MVAAAADLLKPADARIEFLLYLDHPSEASPPAHADVTISNANTSTYRSFVESARAESRGTWLVTIEHPTLRDASLVFAFWQRRHEADVIIASRHAVGADAAAGRLRHSMSRWGNRIVASVLSFPIDDMTCGRRMYRTRVVRDIPIEAEGRELLIELLIRAYGEGAHIAEMPWHVDAPESPPIDLARLARTVRRMHHERNSGNYPDYDSRAYHSKIWLQRYWQRKRFQIINRFAPGAGTCLDVGCGGSRIIKMRPEMVALDLNFKRLRHLQSTNPRRVQATAGDIPFADGSFDIVICSQVIEHTLEGTCVTECVRVLRDDGILVIGTPDYGTFWWPFWEAIYDRVKPHGYVIEHIAHYTYESLTQEVMKAGCKVLEHAYIGGGELIVKAVKRGKS